MHRSFRNTVLFSLLIYSSMYSGLTSAGGPLVLEGPAGNTPVSYQDPSITINIENGKLGALSNTEADALVQQALNLWNGIGTSTIDITIDETLINLDVDITNFNTYLPNVSGTVFNSNDNLNPVVYDDNGKIIDAYFGVGQSDFTIGFAASILTSGSSFFSEGYAVINGKDLQLSNTTFKLLITHEIGHFIGLDHSQADINNQESGSGVLFFCNTGTLPLRNEYPVMYPFACRKIESLHADDISALSALYPDASVNTVFGRLNGRLTDMSGKPVRGANLWVKNVTTGQAYSIVSDYLKQGNGFYQLLLPPGDYTLHANSINTEFNSGSSIGPYALSPNGASFKCPHPIALADYEGNTPGIEVITITVDQTTEIDFSLSQVDIGVCPPPVVGLSSKGGGSGALSVNSLSMLFLLLCGRLLAGRARLLN